MKNSKKLLLKKLLFLFIIINLLILIVGIYQLSINSLFVYGIFTTIMSLMAMVVNLYTLKQIKY